MDSGSSGSMQSSSGGGGGGGGGGGDEEYDSRSASISSFLNHPSSGHFGSISNPQPPLLSHQQSSHQPTFFDPPHSQNLDAFPQSLETQNASLPYNHEMVWSRGLRSEANYGNFGNLKGSSSSSLSSSHSLLGVQGINQAPLASSSQPVEGNATRAALQQFDQPPNVAKNPKKRTRASRRAPTTVLTTDTANFRQMVQEFTGIPTSPFSTGSPYSRRLDLFSTAGSAMRAGQLDTLGSLYPLRPSAQKAQPSSTSPSLFNSSVINALVSNNNASGTNNSITTSIAGTSNSISSSTNNFQVPLNLGLPKQSQNILNMQNQLLTFQPLLQPTLPSSMGNEPFLSTRAQGSTSMPSLDELGMRHQQVNANLSGFSNQGGSEARQARNDDNTARWRDGGTLNNEGQEHLRSFDGNDGNGQRISSFKLNSSSSSDFNPEKVLDNASSGGLEFTNYN